MYMTKVSSFIKSLGLHERLLHHADFHLGSCFPDVHLVCKKIIHSNNLARQEATTDCLRRRVTTERTTSLDVCCNGQSILKNARCAMPQHPGEPNFTVYYVMLTKSIISFVRLVLLPLQ